MSDKRPVYRIIILVDIKQRDLPGHALLKEILEANYPCKVFLLPARSRRAVLAFRPHLVVVMQVLGRPLIEFCRFLKERGILVASLPTEGIPAILDKDFLDYMAGRFTEKALVDLQFFWCQEIMDRALRHGTVTSGQARVIGVPRLDFYHSTMRPLRRQRAALLTMYGLDPNARTLTWTTNFSTADQNIEQLDREIATYNLRVSVLRDLPTLIAAERNTREEIARALLIWAREHQEYNLIIRPHPTEVREFYIRFANQLRQRGLRRVALVIQEPIWDVLEATDVLVQRCCTTGMEAWLVGLPVLEMRLNPGDPMVNPDRDHGSHIVTSYAEFEKAVDFYLRGGRVSEKQENARQVYLQQWFHRIDGQRTLACTRELWDLLSRSDPSSLRLGPRDRWLGAGVWFARRIEAALRLNILRDYLKRKNWRRPDTYLTTRDIRQWQARIRQSGVLEKPAKPRL